MKTKFFKFTVILNIIMVLQFLIPSFKMEVLGADANYNVNVAVTYNQSSAREMLSLVNTFRTGADAWYWNSTDTDKVLANDLSELAYDYTLEKIAMQRAVEVALSFSHTRPNGKNCFTAYRENGYTGYSMGENIAAGSSTASATFTQWEEKDDKYAGQGHRRNMLSEDFDAIGIAHVVYQGVHYWVQELGSSVNTTETPANNNSDNVEVQLASANISNIANSLSQNTLEVNCGGKVDLPTVTTTMQFTDHWPYGRTIEVTSEGTWSIEDGTISKIENNEVVGLKVGNTKLIATTINGEKKEVAVTVKCIHANTTIHEAVLSTCSVKGKGRYVTCNDCGAIVEGSDAELDLAEHTYEYVKEVSPKHEKDKLTEGVKAHYVCKECGKIFTENHEETTEDELKIEAPTHIYEGYKSDETYHWQECGCGNIIGKLEHTGAQAVEENRIEATCQREGSYDEVVYCSVCKKELSRTTKTIEKTSHTESAPVEENKVEATCQKEGSYDEVVYCSVCKEELRRTTKTIEKTQHTEGAPVEENKVEATCTTDGSHDEVIRCTKCNTEISRTNKTDKATGHTNGDIIAENVIEATCITDGSHDEVIRCTKCNAEISRTNKIDKATGHTAGEPTTENVVKATCTTDGSHDEVIRCTKCNAEISRTNKIDKATGHTAGEPTVENVVEATVEKEGSYDEVVYCTKCNIELSRTKKITPKFVYEILEGANSSHQNKDSQEITIKTNGKFDKFRDIKIDGEIVDKSNYTAKEGSTIVTLKADYLNNLAIGEHKISFLYDDGEVETTFKINERNNLELAGDTQKKDDIELLNNAQEKDGAELVDNIKDKNVKNNSTTPKTGDSSNITLWIIGLVISGTLFVIILKFKIKGKNK